MENVTTWGQVEIVTMNSAWFQFWWRVNQIWFPSWSDTLSLPRRKRQGGVLNSCPQQPASLRRRHCHGRAFLSSLEYCTLSRVSGLTPFLVPFKNFVLLQHLSNNNLLLECLGGLVATRENVLTTSLTFFPSKTWFAVQGVTCKIVGTTFKK